MQFPADFIAELKRRNSIEDVISSYVELKRRSRNNVGLCPFHSEKTGSFVVYDESQSYYCFGCSAGGDVITFIMSIENLDYVEAIKYLANRCNMSLPEGEYDDKQERLRKVILEINKDAARFFYSCLISQSAKSVRDYLTNRGLSTAAIKKYGVGYAPDSWDILLKHLKSKGYKESDIKSAGLIGTSVKGNRYSYFRDRVMFPIIDLRGSVIGFGGRNLGENGPKYLNSPDTPVFKKSKSLFSLNFAKTSKAPFLILAEGYMDVIAIHMAGMENVVATLGTALTPEQARLMGRYAGEVVVAYDSDEAGQKATQRAISLLKSVGLNVRILKMQGAKDPDEYIKKYGSDRFKQLVERSGTSTSYQLDTAGAKYNLDLDDGKVDFLKDAVAILASLSSPIERDVYISKLSSQLSVSRQSIEESVSRLIKSRIRAKEKKRRSGIETTRRGENLFDKLNPDRQRYVKETLAEERLIAAVIKDPGLIAHIDNLRFVTEFNSHIYLGVKEQIERDGDFELSGYAEIFTTDEMGYMSGLMAKYATINLDKQDMLDCIKIIERYHSRLSEEDVKHLNPNELTDYVEKLKKDKK